MNDVETEQEEEVDVPGRSYGEPQPYTRHAYLRRAI